MANNEVRIIGGQWKGRKLKFAARPDLRPTLGRVRETLFNWLAPFVREARCLDLYAGSGALGFEALSRGAAEVTFVERDGKAVSEIRSNVERFEARAHVRLETAERFLAKTDESFDIILVDPPFARMPSSRFIADLLEQRLSPEGLLYLESNRRQGMPLAERQIKHGSAGDCQFALYPATAEPAF